MKHETKGRKNESGTIHKGNGHRLTRGDVPNNDLTGVERDQLKCLVRSLKGD